MNKKQRNLYKALESLANTIMLLDENQDVAKELSKKEIEEVVNKFSEKIYEFNIKELYQDVYNYEPIGNTILTEIASKLEIRDF